MGCSLSKMALEFIDTDEYWWRCIAGQLLLTSSASNFDCTGSTASSPPYAVNQLPYAKKLNEILGISVSLLASQSRAAGRGFYVSNASISSGWADESPMTASSDVLDEDMRGAHFFDGQADDTGSVFTAYRRRSRTQILDSRDHGENSFRAMPRRPYERRFRSIEECVPSPQPRVWRYMQPMREHVVQRWKRLRRKPCSDSPTSAICRSSSLRLPGSSQRSGTQCTLDTELKSNDNAGPVGIYTRQRPEAHKTRSAPVAHQHLVSGLSGGYPPIATRSAPTLNKLNDDGESTALNEPSSEYTSYFTLGEQQAEQSLRTKPSSARLLRVSTAGTTVFSPPIIVEARPNAEKLDHSGNMRDSSSGSSGGVDGMSFL